MECTWVVEPFAIDKTPQLIESLEKAGKLYRVLTHEQVQDIRKAYRFNPYELPELVNGGCSVLYCSLNTARANVKYDCYPGIYYNHNHFFCTEYFNHYWDDLLNQGMFVTYEMLRRSKSMLFEKFGNNGAIFIRPNVGFKTFTGTVVTEEHFVKDTEYLGYGEIDKHELILVAEPKNIHAEYRVVIANKKAITMSQYRRDGIYELDGTHIPEVMKYAEDVTAGWQPESVFVADIAKVTEGYKLIEINSFSCSGLYNCNTDIIVEEVSKVAEQEWEELYNVDY